MGKQVYNYTALLNNFSENMKKRRVELSLSQKELASIVGVSVRTIQNYENKKNYTYLCSYGSYLYSFRYGIRKVD